MTVIQGQMPVAGSCPKVNQTNQPDGTNTEAFGLSMLLALIAPQTTQITQQQNPPTPSTLNGQPVLGDEAAGMLQTVAERETAESDTSPNCVRLAKQGMKLEQASNAPVGSESQQSSVRTEKLVLPASGAVLAADELGDSSQSVPKHLMRDAPATTERQVPHNPPLPGGETKGALPDVTIESAEVSRGQQDGKPAQTMRWDRTLEQALGIREQVVSSAQRQALERPTTLGRGPTHDLKLENQGTNETAEARRSKGAEQQSPTVKLTKLSVDAVALGREVSQSKTAEVASQMTNSNPAERRRPIDSARSVVREPLVAAAEIDGIEDGARTEKPPRSDGPLLRDSSQAARGNAVDQERASSARVETSTRAHSDVDGPLFGLRTLGVTETAPGSRAIDGRVEQAALKTQAEEQVFQAKPEDRVTLKFTDEAGVEGRLRVAMRGQSVRATIVSNDPATAERLGAGVSELQRTLDKQGFRDPQITVQQARGPDESGSIALASGSRGGSDSASGLQTTRTTEDQTNRERQQPNSRDNQQQHSGRSQQRSKERQER